MALRVSASADGLGVSDNCRHYAASLLCAACDPLIGIGYYRGVCADSCIRWWRACSEDWFTVNDVDAGMTLVPCTATSLLCFPLRDALQSSSQFCEMAALRTA